jgi:hypothetical protein
MAVVLALGLGALDLDAAAAQAPAATVTEEGVLPGEQGASEDGVATEEGAPTETGVSDGRGLGGRLATLAWYAAALVVGAGLGWAVGRRRPVAVHGRPATPSGNRATSATGAVSEGSPPSVRTSQGPGSGSTPVERDPAALVDGLVDGLIASHDLADTDGQRARITATLRRAGIAIVDPATGERFDPERHRAMRSAPAPSPEDRERVASVERPGWVRGEQVLRYPEVVVWQ